MKTEEDQLRAMAAGHRVPAPLLSAIADGEATAAEVELVAGQWAQSSALRAEWHTLQLIGDVMRSEELAHAPGRDEALLVAVRRRLADEPVVLAPSASTPRVAPPPSERRSELRARRRWMSSAAMVAGVATVAVALMVSRQGLPGSDGEPGATPAGQLATLQAPATGPSPGAIPVQLTAVSGPDGVQAVRTERVLRDEQLDRFLAAHRQFGGPAVPGQVLRSATSLAPAER